MSFEQVLVLHSFVVIVVGYYFVFLCNAGELAYRVRFIRYDVGIRRRINNVAGRCRRHFFKLRFQCIVGGHQPHVWLERNIFYIEPDVFNAGNAAHVHFVFLSGRRVDTHDGFVSLIHDISGYRCSGMVYMVHHSRGISRYDVHDIKYCQFGWVCFVEIEYVPNLHFVISGIDILYFQLDAEWCYDIAGIHCIVVVIHI